MSSTSTTWTVDTNTKSGGAQTFSTPISSFLDIEDTGTAGIGAGGKLRLGSNDDTVMVSTDRLGVIEFAGAEDTSSTMTVGARIEAVADATWSASENGASLDFYTTDGNAVQTQRMTILADGNVGIGDAAPACKLEVAGAIAGGVIAITASADDTDVSGAFLVKVSTNGGTVVIGGFTGGVAGQVIHIIKDTTANNITLEHLEGIGGTQQFALCTAADETLAGYGGWTLVCDGSSWYAVSSPTGAADSA